MALYYYPGKASIDSEIIIQATVMKQGFGDGLPDFLDPVPRCLAKGLKGEFAELLRLLVQQVWPNS